MMQSNKGLHFYASAIFVTLILCDTIGSTFSLSAHTAHTSDFTEHADYTPIELNTFNSDELQSPTRADKLFSDFESSINDVHGAADDLFNLKETNSVKLGDFNDLDTEYPLSIAQEKLQIEGSEIDSVNDYVRMYALYGHTLPELPNYLTNHIRFTAKPKIVARPPTSSSPITDLFKDRVKAIYPGTLWCGGGTQARNEHEVGLFRNTDICCKAHDKCPIFIEAGKERKGLKNNGLFTRSHCKCDQLFYNCLKKINSLVSNKIGYTYFNLLRPKCFRKQYKITGCKKWSGKKCLVHFVDPTLTSKWQWFDNLLF